MRGNERKKVLSLAVALIMIFVLISMISGQTELFKHIIISLQYKHTKGKKSITVSCAKICGIKGYQVRTYKVYKGKNIYSKWSSIKNIKTK